MVRTSHLSLLEKCKPHLGPSASQDRTLVLAGLAFSSFSDEPERSSSPGYGGRENIAVGTWNVRTLRPAGKLEQLTHAMSRYHWNTVGLCEMRRKNFGEMSTDDRHKVYFSGEEGKHEYGVGLLVHKDIVGAVLVCQPVSSRLISIRLRAAPFNITIIQVYAPTSGHDDSEVDHFYQQLQETIDKTPQKDILVVQGDWNAKVGKDAQADWGEVCGPYCNVETNERGLRLLEFETFNNLVLTNTLGPHKPSRRWTWHSPDGKHHNQIDYILVKKRFRLGVNIHRTRSLPGADIGSDHDLVMMTFQVRLKKMRTFFLPIFIFIYHVNNHK